MDYRVEAVPVDVVRVPERHRALRMEKVDQLAASIEAVGLKTPISVYQDGDDKVVLIAGLHRLRACEKLGWDTIPAVFLDTADAIERELWEIDENLMRAELTPAQEAEHLKRRQELWLEREKQKSGTSCPTLTGRGHTAFASETAEAVGRSKRDINRAISRADRIAPDVLAAVQGTDLDKGTRLDALAKLPVEQQRRAVSEVKLPDEPLNDFEIVQKQVAALMAAWNKAGPEAREQFLARIDTPTFDKTKAGRAA